MKAQSLAKPAVSMPSQGFTWDIDIPLLTNRFMVYDLSKVVVITIAIFAVIFAMITIASDGGMDLRKFFILLKICGLVAAILITLMVLVMLLFFFNRFPMRFFLSPRQVRVASLSRQGKWGNRLAVILGALAGKPGIAGAGLLAMAQEMVAMNWPEVKQVKVHRQARVISLLNSWRVVLRLYCTPENFPQVLAWVREHAPAGREPGKKPKHKV